MRRNAMSRRVFLGKQIGTVAALAAAPGLSAPGQSAPPRERGVSLAGPEFGVGSDFSNAKRGKFGRAYTYNTERTVAYFCERGIRLLRLPLRWERLQPQLGEALDNSELGRVKTFVGWARKHGGKVILDIHNYARYRIERNGRGREMMIDERDRGETPVTRMHFADLWTRLSGAFHDEPAVYAYGLMNEPHDLGRSDWKAISQAAVTAIRRDSDKKRILIAGDSWSNAPRFTEINGPKPWIKDPAGNVAYEAHCYFDHDFSGRYGLTYEAEQARDPKLESRGRDRLRPFVRWCQTNRVAGFLGEFGIPPDPRWQSVLAGFLEELDRAGMESCYWAAGEWWGDYPLSIQPRRNYQQAAPQLRTLIGEQRE
jgi:endoglucanase